MHRRLLPVSPFGAREYYVLMRSPKKTKKFRIIYDNFKYIDFGDAFYEDFTIHKDIKRKNKYIARHQRREDWTKSGINTAGFWSFWLLWSKPTIEESIKDIEKRFGIKIIHLN